jgi:hypothetical protein
MAEPARQIDFPTPETEGSTMNLTEKQKEALVLEMALNNPQNEISIDFVDLSDTDFKLEVARAFSIHKLEHKLLK